MGTDPVDVELDIKSAIEDAQARCGERVGIWYLWESGAPAYCPFRNMRELEQWHLTPRFWTQERAMVFRHDGLFLTCRRNSLKIGNEPGVVTVRSQWGMRTVPSRDYTATAKRFNITHTQLDQLLTWQL